MLHLAVCTPTLLWLLYLLLFHIFLYFKDMTTYDYIQIWRAKKLGKVQDEIEVEPNKDERDIRTAEITTARKNSEAEYVNNIH